MDESQLKDEIIDLQRENQDLRLIQKALLEACEVSMRGFEEWLASAKMFTETRARAEVVCYELQDAIARARGGDNVG